VTAAINFVRQQGFRDEAPDSCGLRYPALMWQPRVIGGLVVVGLLSQSWPWFGALGALLWWNALVPRLNPFDAAYNRLVAAPKGRPPLGAAFPPRRFSQGMAGTFMLAIALSLRFGPRPLAWAVEGALVLALAALIFGRFCLGSWFFHVVTGQVGYANRTLPWAHPDPPSQGVEPR
jgi:uncharacterized protein DUF4395